MSNIINTRPLRPHTPYPSTVDPVFSLPLQSDRHVRGALMHVSNISTHMPRESHIEPKHMYVGTPGHSGSEYQMKNKRTYWSNIIDFRDQFFRPLRPHVSHDDLKKKKTSYFIKTLTIIILSGLTYYVVTRNVN